MRAWEYASEITLLDERVAVSGDWHGNTDWVRTLGRAMPTLAPGITTMLQLGDWWMDPSASDEAFAGTDIERVYVTTGNHEPWSDITPLLDAHPGAAVRVSNLTWILPRPARLTIGGRMILSLGGAASVDKAWRREGIDWWPDEDITDAHVAAAVAGGRADVMLTHESPSATPVGAVQAVLRANPFGFPDDALAASAASQARVAEAWNAVRPQLLLHGHMHIPGGGITADGRRVASLGRDTQQGNLGFLDLRSLKMQTPSLRQIREAAET